MENLNIIILSRGPKENNEAKGQIAFNKAFKVCGTIKFNYSHFLQKRTGFSYLS